MTDQVVTQILWATTKFDAVSQLLRSPDIDTRYLNTERIHWLHKSY